MTKSVVEPNWLQRCDWVGNAHLPYLYQIKSECGISRKGEQRFAPTISASTLHLDRPFWLIQLAISIKKITVAKFWLTTITKISLIKPTLITIILTSLVPWGTKKVAAEVVLSCDVAAVSQEIINTAIADYLFEGSNTKNTVVSNRIKTKAIANVEGAIQITNLGVRDAEGNLVGILNAIADSLIEVFIQQGLNPEEANTATVATLSQWASLPNSSSAEVIAAVKQSLIEKLGQERTELIAPLPDSLLLSTLARLQPATLTAIGLSAAEIETLSQIAIAPQTEGSFAEQIQSVTTTAINSLERPEAKEIVTEAQARVELELNNIRQGQTILEPGSNLSFRFRLTNEGESTASIELPTVQSITENALVGAGTVTGVTYNLAASEQGTITDTPQDVSIPGGQSLDLEIQVQIAEIPKETISSLGINLQTSCGDNNPVQTFNILPPIAIENVELIDPLGQISGCAGELLEDYLGFSVGLYDIDANDPTESQPSGLTPLTTTELPNDPDNKIPAGIEPNTQNNNPFFLTNNDEGKYSFLFNENTDQLDKGRNYILVVDPGEDSIYNQRRVKLTIGDRQGRIVEYTATSLDGRPISAQSDATTVTGQIVLVEDAERVGLNLAVLDLATDICDAEEIAITKTGDRASAEPGDIVLYRLAVTNLASVPLANFQIVDTLPPGFNLMSESIMAEANSQKVGIETIPSSDRVVNFTANTTLEQGQTLNLVYAAQITPDAVRGSAENSAIVNAQRTDNNFTVKDGPAIHNLRLEPGIMRDSGTLIGRVFVDKNFDGEQQKGEPGIPNAVIYLENGNRIITDADGLFSVANVLPGYHTGILDLTTIPEYRLAPNLRFSEGNSNSRLVNLEPGGMVRMNFGVTPTAEGEPVSQPQATSEKTPTPEDK